MKPTPQQLKKEYDRRRYLANKESILLKTKKYKEENRELLKQNSKEYYADRKARGIPRCEKGKASREWAWKTEKGRDYTKKFTSKPINKLKNSIRAKTRNYNLKNGICSRCEMETKTEFHHISYEPNIFEEVCKQCHINQHH